MWEDNFPSTWNILLGTEKEGFWLQPRITEWLHDLAYHQDHAHLFLLHFVILGHRYKHTNVTVENILPQILHLGVLVLLVWQAMLCLCGMYFITRRYQKYFYNKKLTYVKI